jgi:hypothetical protein
MNLTLQQLPEATRGKARAKLLAPEAAVALAALEKDTGGLLYHSLWHDAASTLLARRLRIGSHLPGYDPHGYGLALTLEGAAILESKKISYEDLLYLMKRRGWYCHRRDGKQTENTSFQFLFLGETADEYTKLATFDPLSWDKPIEQKIHDKYLKDFALSPAQVQSALLKMGFFHGTVDGNYDAYMREGIMAFQRAWQMSETGTPNMTLQRTLAFLSAEVSVISG